MCGFLGRLLRMGKDVDDNGTCVEEVAVSHMPIIITGHALGCLALPCSPSAFLEALATTTITNRYRNIGSAR